MRRIGGRLGRSASGCSGADVEIPPLLRFDPNLQPLSGVGKVSGGQFDWGGRLPKGNGGAQRFPQAEWKPAIERIGIRELDCETYMSSRGESRSK